MKSDSDLSVFTGILKDFGYDSLFLKTNNTYTIFAPDNEGIKTFLDTGSMNDWILNFLVSDQYVENMVLPGQRKILTLGGKYILFQHSGNSTYIDGNSVDDTSLLFRNGRYFKMRGMALPKQSIYEYLSGFNPTLKKYVDRQDSVTIDVDKSTPVGFDTNGNVIWDTVPNVINMFEQEYFPIKHEFRNKTATLVFPDKQVYENALTRMAQDFAGIYVDYRDIPYDWQARVLIPQLLYNGVFQYSLEENEFLRKGGRNFARLKNILGDSISVFYSPVDKKECSNGYVYSYSDYVIPSSLYIRTATFEAEWLLKSIGINKYDWNDAVSVISDKEFLPSKVGGPASNKSFMMDVFTPEIDENGDTIKYSGRFTLEFSSAFLLPLRYMMIVRTLYNVGGIYDVYVNDKLVKTIDYDDYQRYHGLYFTNTGERIPSVDGFSIFDCSLDNITQYGKARIRFEYKGPGKLVPQQGLAIDYIDFIPENIFKGYDKYRKSVK